MSEHFADNLIKRFPVLAENESYERSELDSYEILHTPAGDIEVIFFYNRKDFEHTVYQLFCKKKGIKVPESMGSIYITGLPEIFVFKRVSIVLLTNGPYSAVPAEAVGMDSIEWNKISLIIRKYHELTHFIQHKMFPENKDVLRDEVKADLIGIVAATGYYDRNMAALFMGTEGEHYREGGRLQNYLSECNISDIETAVRKVNEYIDFYGNIADGFIDQNYYEQVLELEQHVLR